MFPLITVSIAKTCKVCFAQSSSPPTQMIFLFCALTAWTSNAALSKLAFSVVGCGSQQHWTEDILVIMLTLLLSSLECESKFSRFHLTNMFV